jgi:hypothetical protein
MSRLHSVLIPCEMAVDILMIHSALQFGLC